MLHPFDDLPLHQGPDPLLHLSSDSPGLYDRYFHNGHDANGRIFFGVALGVYPNRRVMDASFSVVVDGVQHSVRASRQCDRDRTTTTVGPIELTVVQPMLEHRLRVNPRLGVGCDLTWRATSAVVEEPIFRRVVDGRPTFAYTRITQFGRWSGWIKVDGTCIDLADVGRVDGCRDRSWGMRNAAKGIAGPHEHRQFFWQWVPTTFDDLCTHLADVVWEPGTRWLRRATVVLEAWRREPMEVVYEPVMRFQMNGIGYLHPEWNHGAWKGVAAETRDSLVVADVDPTDRSMLHVQQLCRATSGDRVGVAAFEVLAIGPHTPSGLTGTSDGAR